MSFLETVRRAKGYLQEQRRVSLRALQSEFGLDADALETLVAELVDVRQVADRGGNVLIWTGASGASVPEPLTPNTLTPNTLPSGERRQLTLLFCDLVGSTELAAQMDPEDWRTLVAQYQRTGAATVERFGGRVAKYLGDGLLVYFGYPQAHDDDAERAVRADQGTSSLAIMGWNLWHRGHPDQALVRAREACRSNASSIPFRLPTR